jgi:hypothetical protein
LYIEKERERKKYEEQKSLASHPNKRALVHVVIDRARKSRRVTALPSLPSLPPATNL